MKSLLLLVAFLASAAHGAERYVAAGAAPICEVDSAGKTHVYYSAAQHPSFKCTHSGSTCSCTLKHPTHDKGGCKQLESKAAGKTIDGGGDCSDSGKDGAAVTYSGDNPAAAFDAAADGDVIVLGEGTFGWPTAQTCTTEITLQGQGRDKTIIDANVAVGGVTLAEHFIVGMSGCKLKLKDITFKNGNPTIIDGQRRGGAVRIESGATGTFDNVGFFNNNKADPEGHTPYGGAVAVTSGTGTFNNCWFEANEAWNGGAVGIANGFATFTGCTFKSNKAGAGGGGTWAHNHLGQTNYNDGNSWIENSARKGGGVMQDVGECVFTGSNTFTGNTAGESAPQCSNNPSVHWPDGYARTKGFTASTGLACSTPGRPAACATKVGAC